MHPPSGAHHTKHRTTVLIDPALIDQAGRVLGTSGTTTTIRCALADVVARDKRRQLASWDLGEMTLDDLDQLRRARASE
jgi:Arc/MetJ family transcription regulator